MIKIDEKYLNGFITYEEIKSFQDKISDIDEKLNICLDSENDYKGWVHLPTEFSDEKICDINQTAEKIRNNSDVFIVIGIGGSYLGAQAAIDFLFSQNYNYLSRNKPKIFFVGNNISSGHIEEIMEICQNKDVSLNVISKSGTTTEPAIAFRIFKKFMEDKYGKESAKDRIFCTTDKKSGLLLKIAQKEGYKCFEIPSNIGGRYSVLTAVGLLPIAVCGGNIKNILFGAADAEKKYLNKNLNNNDCYKYAVIRNILFKKGKLIEIIAGYEPRIATLFEWWKQLFGESEGKEKKGIFPSSVIFSRDLHSMGQFIQDGNKIIFETVVKSEINPGKLIIQEDNENLDNLNYLKGKSLNYINDIAFRATAKAHYNGEVPNIIINIKDFSEFTLGHLIYFFEKACAVSCCLMNVNPFNQPGVEAYKTNMFKMLGKP